jgi:hypothetical protein
MGAVTSDSETLTGLVVGFRQRHRKEPHRRRPHGMHIVGFQLDFILPILRPRLASYLRPL